MTDFLAIKLNPSITLKLLERRKIFLSEKNPSAGSFFIPVNPVIGIMNCDDEGIPAKEISKKIHNLEISDIAESNGFIFFEGNYSFQKENGIEKRKIIFPCGIEGKEKQDFNLEEYFCQMKGFVNDQMKEGKVFLKAKSFKVCHMKFQDCTWQSFEEAWGKS